MSTKSRKVEKMNCRRCSREPVYPYPSLSNATSPYLLIIGRALMQDQVRRGVHMNHMPLCAFALAAVPNLLSSCKLTIPLFSGFSTYVSTGGSAYPLFVLLTLVWNVVPVLVLDSTGQEEAVASVLVEPLMGGV
jgi:hypothetical protein